MTPPGTAVAPPEPQHRVLVARPGLARRLDAVPPGGVGLLVASAGSGKSVLLQQWSAARPGLRTARLALTRRHDDALVFARDLVTAIRAVAPQVSTGLTDVVMTGGTGLGVPFLEGLTAELARVTGEVVLVLDDLHALDNAGLVAELGEAADLLPDNVRVVVSTRRDPPWPLGWFRANGGLVEIRGADLAFGVEESQQLLAGVSGRKLTDDQVAALVGRTDGWAVGLQLAALSLRHAPDLGAAIASFAGSDRLVAEYLLEEVLEHLEPGVRDFLLRTSVLECLSADVCEAVTGRQDARELLESLERDSLFVIAMDPAGTRFRYHHLFADLLRYRLRIEDREAAPLLHRRAADWLLDHGETEQAVGHLLAAGEHRRAFEVIARVGYRFFERGQAATLVTWLAEIEERYPDRPAAVGVHLMAAQTAADLSSGAAETHRRLVRRTDLTLGERVTADALLASLVLRDLHPEAALEAARDVLDAVPLLQETDVVDFLGVGGLDSVRVIAGYSAGVALFLQGDVAGAESTLVDVLAQTAKGYPVWRIHATGGLALVQAYLGRSGAALQLAEAALETARASGLSGHVAVTLARMAYGLAQLDRGNPEAAARELAESDRQTRRRPAAAAHVRDLQRALTARLTAVTDGPGPALGILREPAASAVEPPVLVAANRALESRLLLALGDRVGARSSLEDRADRPAPPDARIDLALDRGDLPAARQLLGAWCPDEGDLRAQVGHLIREAAALEAAGHRSAAQEALRRALARAEPEGLWWPFLEVPAVQSMVRRQAQPGSPYSDGRHWGLARGSRARGAPPQPLVEPLTDRELAVLEYLPRRTKNKDIAADLFVSVNTLKTHLRSIYRKLGVGDRDEAVARARDLGLLPGTGM